jgi:hypothetical protein
MCLKPESPASHPSKSSTTASRTVNIKMLAALFIALKLESIEKTRDINPFYTQEVLYVTAGKVKNSSQLKNFTLLVEDYSDQQTETTESTIV